MCEGSNVGAVGAMNTLCLPGYGTFELRSAETGLVYEIFVWVPEGEAPPLGFPVLYVLDANSDFLTVSETVRRVSRKPAATGVTPSIVVGIGYPNTANYDMGRRYRDLTLSGPHGSADQGGAAYGGQGAFLRFLEQQLVPCIQAQYHAHADRRSIIGHSLGGYFVLEMLAHRSVLFDGYVSFSPSIWWDKSGLRERLSQKAEPVPGRRVYLAVGRYEQDPSPWSNGHEQDEDYHALRAQRRMVDNARELAADIANTIGSGGDVRFEIGEEEDHATIVTTLLCRALRFVQPIEVASLGRESWQSFSPR